MLLHQIMLWEFERRLLYSDNSLGKGRFSGFDLNTSANGEKRKIHGRVSPSVRGKGVLGQRETWNCFFYAQVLRLKFGMVKTSTGTELPRILGWKALLTNAVFGTLSQIQRPVWNTLMTMTTTMIGNDSFPQKLTLLIRSGAQSGSKLTAFRSESQTQVTNQPSIHSKTIQKYV